MLIKEVEQRISSSKPLTTQQARIKSLQTQKDNASKALKAERERQKVIKAQQPYVERIQRHGPIQHILGI